MPTTQTYPLTFTEADFHHQVLEQAQPVLVVHIGFDLPNGRNA